MNPKVERNIPLPEPLRETAGRDCLYPWATMRKGDSFLVEPRNGESLRSCRNRVMSAARSWSDRHGGRFVSRSVKQGTREGIRVWKTEE